MKLAQMGLFAITLLAFSYYEMKSSPETVNIPTKKITRVVKKKKNLVKPTISQHSTKKQHRII